MSNTISTIKTLNILIATHHLIDYAGSETYTYTLAQELSRIGHRVIIYSPLLGTIANKIIATCETIKITDELQKIRNINFDIIHAQHNITAIQARVFFPKTPMILNVHGVLPALENPPFINIGLSYYVVVSEEIQKKLIYKGIQTDKIKIIRNFIDTKRFSTKTAINNKLKKVLIISNRLHKNTKTIITRACKKLSLDYFFIGGIGNCVWNTEHHINNVDLVITLGRGALEAMSCGRNVIVYDYNGGDGMITPESYNEIRQKNFSGRRYSLMYNEQDLMQELCKYTSSFGNTNRKIIENNHSVETVNNYV
jgi:glycosyltransferase involved in cell wall biosynthesis